MSHYVVAVIHKPDQEVEDLLAPYDENTQVEEYIEFSKQEAIDYAKENYAKDKPMSDSEAWAIMADGRKTDKKGNIYSTYNPKSKWDWWEIGGRWDKYITTKQGEKANAALIKNIDTKIDQKEYDSAIDFWEVVVDKTKKAKDDSEYWSFYKPEYYLEYYGDKETYAKCMASFSTYAVITPDGEWHSCGRMGWFGCSDETPEELRDWHLNYKERFLNKENGDLILTIVDCHI